MDSSIKFYVYKLATGHKCMHENPAVRMDWTSQIRLCTVLYIIYMYHVYTIIARLLAAKSSHQPELAFWLGPSCSYRGHVWESFSPRDLVFQHPGTKTLSQSFSLVPSNDDRMHAIYGWHIFNSWSFPAQILLSNMWVFPLNPETKSSNFTLMIVLICSARSWPFLARTWPELFFHKW